MTNPEKPASLPERLSSIWDELLPQVRGITAMELEALCEQVYRMRDARARIEKDGAVVRDGKGAAVPHPAIGIEKAAQAEVRSWMKAYGT